MIKSPYQGSDDPIRNRDLSGIDGSDIVVVLLEGRSQRSSKKAKDLFDLDFMNSKSKSCKMTIHFEYFPPAIDVIRFKSWGCNLKLLLFFGVGYNGKIFGQLEQLPRKYFPCTST